MELLQALGGTDGVALARLELLVRLLLAAVLGGLVGLERELSGKPAGFRTNLLICVGAAVLTDLSIAVARAADPVDPTVIADPARIAAQIVSGIGFLGAGTIIQARGSVIGLTTAATLWVVAAIGMSVGAGAYVEAVGTTVLVIAALFLLGRLELRMLKRRSEQRIQMTLSADPAALDSVRASLADAGFAIEVRELEKWDDGYRGFFVLSGPGDAREAALRELLARPEVRKISTF